MPSASGLVRQRRVRLKAQDDAESLSSHPHEDLMWLQHLPLWLSSVGIVGFPTLHRTLVCLSVIAYTMGLGNCSNRPQDHNTRLSLHIQHGQL